MPLEKENTYQHPEIIIEKMVKKSGLTQNKFAEDILGIRGVNLSRAKKSGKIPDKWFELVKEKLGITKEELCQQPQKVTMTLEQSWGDASPDMERERFQQDLDGLFAVVKRWQEEEHGADSLTSMQFIQLFHERIPELGEWIKKQKGGGSENSSSGNLSVAGGQS